MNDNRYKIIILTSLYFLFVLAVTTAINRLLWHDMIKPIVAGLIFAAVILTTLLSKPLQRYIEQLPMPHIATILLILFGVLFAQYTRTTHTTFPFVPWHMYTHVPDSYRGHLIKCIGTTTSGDEAIINTVGLFSFFSHDRMGANYNRLVSSFLWPAPDELHTDDFIQQDPQAMQQKTFLKAIGANIRHIFAKYQRLDKETRWQQLHELMTAFGILYNQQNPDNPIESVKTVVESFDLRDKHGSKKAKVLAQINL